MFTGIKRVGTFCLFTLTAAICTNQAAAELVGYWTFDSDTASALGAVANLVDSTYDGEQNGTVSFSSDTPAALAGGNSLDLTSASTYVRIKGSSLTQGETGDYDGRFDSDLGQGFAISAWVKGLPGTWEPFISKKGETDHGYQIRRYAAGNNLGITFRDGTGGAAVNDDNDTGVSINGTGWHHVAYNWDHNHREAWVDGVKVVDVVSSQNLGSPTNEYLLFGARDNPAGTIGAIAAVQLDDVAFYTRALAPKQIEHLAGGGDAQQLAQLAALGIGPVPTGSFGIRVVHSNGTIADMAQAIDSLESGGGTIVDSSAQVINYFDSAGGGGNGQIGGDSEFPGISNANNFVMIANADISIATAGTYTFYAQGDDGFQLRILGEEFLSVSDTGNGTAQINADTLFNNALGGNVNGFGVINLAAGSHSLEYIFMEGTGGAYAELWAAPGSHTSFSGAFQLVGTGLFPHTVPEPSTLVLAVLALVGLAGLLRWRTRKN